MREMSDYNMQTQNTPYILRCMLYIILGTESKLNFGPPEYQPVDLSRRHHTPNEPVGSAIAFVPVRA